MIFLLKAIISLVFIILFFNLVILYRNTHLPRDRTLVLPSTYGLNYEDICFKTGDGLTLAGWFIPGNERNKKKKVIIVCHGLGTNRSDVMDIVSGLAGAGYNVLTFDFRGHGHSQGRFTTFGYYEQRDLKAALGYLKSRKDIAYENPGVYGLSMGGAVALMVAAENADIKAVVVDSSYTSLDETLIHHFCMIYPLPRFPFAYWAIWTYRLRFGVNSSRISPLNSMPRLAPRAVMIVNGQEDLRMPADGARRLYEAAGDPRYLWIVPGAEHCQGCNISGPEYMQRIIRFFNTHLKD